MNVSLAPRLNSLLFKLLRRFAVGLLAFATIFAPAFSQTASASPKGSSLETFAKLREAWVQDLRTKQLEPILEFYAADAAFLQPTGERLTGSSALRTLFQTIMANFNSDLTLHSQSLETSGNLAYDSGDFKETLTNIASGAKITSKGSYIIIYKRQPSGSWLIVQHVWTGTPPPVPERPPTISRPASACCFGRRVDAATDAPMAPLSSVGCETKHLKVH